MASTPYELIAGFTHSTLRKVTGEPMFEDLKIIHPLLNSNAMGVSGIITTDAEYFAVANDGFLPPENPGLAAKIVTGMMGIHIAEMGRLHTTVTYIYRTYNNVDQAFKKMLIDAFED
jgi:hypothetical protein